MAVKLLGPAYAPCSRRVLLCQIEKDIEFEIVHVDIIKGEQKKPDSWPYKVKGYHKVQCREICRAGDLSAGQDFEERALIEQWLEVEGQNFGPHAHALVYQLFFAPKVNVPQDKAFIESSAQNLGEVLDVYEERLSRSKYLAGDFYSLADLSHIPYTEYIMNATDKGYLIRNRKHVNAWWEDIFSRPAWKKVLAM